MDIPHLLAEITRQNSNRAARIKKIQEDENVAKVLRDTLLKCLPNRIYEAIAKGRDLSGVKNLIEDLLERQAKELISLEFSVYPVTYWVFVDPTLYEVLKGLNLLVFKQDEEDEPFREKCSICFEVPEPKHKRTWAKRAKATLRSWYI